MKSFYIRTFGCKLNQADSASVRGAMLAKGLLEAPAPEAADLLLINTCTVTHKADSGARKEIRKLKQLSPDSRIVITGCYAERDAELLSAMPEVDQVFGLSQKKELHQYITGIVPDDLDFGGIDAESHYGDKSRAFLKVQEGCDLKCAFCVIRVVRGRSRSLETEEIIRRLQVLKEGGFEEVVLTGIHLGLWGRDIGIKGVGKGMLHLLHRIAESDGMPKIRLNSLEPYVIKDETLELLASSDRFAHHLHLSIQSGSERILRLMKRRPHVEQMYHVAHRARELMPDCGIGADVIVGFPGETEEDFQQTFDLMTKTPFTYAHVFAFSPRPGTEAVELPDHVDPREISNRSARLRGAVAERNMQFRKSMIGVDISAILLQQKDEEGRHIVLTDNYIHVNADGNGSNGTGALHVVKITGADESTTSGMLIA